MNIGISMNNIEYGKYVRFYQSASMLQQQEEEILLLCQNYLLGKQLQNISALSTCAHNNFVIINVKCTICH